MKVYSISAAASLPQARALRHGGESAGSVSGPVLRLERAAFSRDTRMAMAGLKEGIQRKGIFCALYSDRGSHFWLTPKAEGKIDPHRLTPVGRALRELGVQMIPAYSPQARGRSERNSGTWQGRLPQELRLRGIGSLEAANRFLREHYIAEFNTRFQMPAAQWRCLCAAPAKISIWSSPCSSNVPSTATTR